MSEIENSHRAPNSDVVIIPTYNEKENIEAIIDAVLALDGDFDVLVVDDNSPDGTHQLELSLTHHYHHFILQQKLLLCLCQLVLLVKFKIIILKSSL